MRGRRVSAPHRSGALDAPRTGDLAAGGLAGVVVDVLDRGFAGGGARFAVRGEHGDGPAVGVLQLVVLAVVELEPGSGLRLLAVTAGAGAGGVCAVGVGEAAVLADYRDDKDNGNE